MTTRRYFHTATLLPDGKVLITGGEVIEGTSFKALSSAELYDPRTGMFSPTGSMSTPRWVHSATLLPDGKVLIAGGANGTFRDVNASAELYDPATGIFGPTAAMVMPRVYHTATLLNNGKVLMVGGQVLIAGGLQATLGSSTSAELCDPATGTFTATGDMNEPACETATLLPNGKVLITRGIVYDPEADLETFVHHAEPYDPSTGTFAFTGDTTSGHTDPNAILLLNGKVLLAGGDYGDGDGASDVAELYDPASGSFAATGRLTAGRKQNSTTLLPDGTVLFAGGHIGANLAASAEIYDPVQATASRTGSMPTARELHTATLLKDGRVLIAGGDDQRYWLPETILSSALVYTPLALAPAPELLTLTGDGQGQGATQHGATYQLVSPDNPAASGEVLSIYCTGLAHGGMTPPQVAIGGRMAEVLWFGSTPGFAGLNQINARVPEGVVPSLSVPVRLNYIGRPSNEVTISVQ